MNSPAGNVVSPFGCSDEDGYVWLKGNVHTHTTNSDGRAEPQERVEGYAEQGYEFLCLSDHYAITRIDALQTPEGFVLIQGAELHPDNPFGGQVHHFVALNIDAEIDSKKMPPQHVIDEVRRQGGSIWQAHPHWSSVNVMRDVLPLRGLAGLEVFNTTCCRAGRGESSIHWDDWMEQEDRLYPALATDDAHARDEAQRDTYGGWTMARVKERTATAVVEALEKGMSYASTGPEIVDIRLHRVDDPEDEKAVVEVAVRCSEAQRIAVVCDITGTEYRKPGQTFDQATFTIRANARWARFEVVGVDGAKAWSQPFDLTKIERE